MRNHRRPTGLMVLLFLICFAVLPHAQARNYDPVSGRFTTMDVFEGDPERPASLHKYAYAHCDPVNLSDPTGMFVEAEMVGRALQKTAAGLQTVAVSGARQTAHRQIIKTVTKLLATSSVLLLLEGDDASSRQRRGNIPIMYYSRSEYPVIAANIHNAQNAIGSSRKPDLLHYIGPFKPLQDQQRRDALRPYRNKPISTDDSWDEYPFASTFEGGAGARVVAAPTSEQSKQGLKHATFYRQNRMTMGAPFYVKVIP